MTRCPRCGCDLTVELSERQDIPAKMTGDDVDVTYPMSEWLLTATGIEALAIEIDKAERYRNLFEE